jgi:hypothetical protein
MPYLSAVVPLALPDLVRPELTDQPLGEKLSALGTLTRGGEDDGGHRWDLNASAIAGLPLGNG